MMRVHHFLKAGRAMTLCWIANAQSKFASIRLACASPLSDPTSIVFGTIKLPMKAGV